MQFEEPGSIIKHGKPEPKLSLTVGNKNEIKCNKEPKKTYTICYQPQASLTRLWLQV